MKKFAGTIAKIKYLGPLILVIAYASTSCGSKSGSSEESGAWRIMPPQPPQSEPIVSALTPPTFRSAASLSLLQEEEIDCHKTTDNRRDLALCEIRKDIITRVLNPTAGFGLRRLSGTADERIVEMYDRADSGYIPCLDAEHQGGLVYGHGEHAEETPAYLEKTLDARHSFDDGSSFDLNFPHTVSCYENHEDRLAVMVGRKDGTYYNRNTTANSGGKLVAIDAKDNVHSWLAIGDRLGDRYPENGRETLWFEDAPQTYEGSTFIMNFRAYPEAKIMEVSQIGNQDCGWRMITNDEALLLEGNLNEIGFCYPNDTHSLDFEGEHQADHEPEIVAIVRCYDIRDDQVKELESLEFCEENGLTTDTFTVQKLSRANFKTYNSGYVITGMENPGINEYRVVPAGELIDINSLLGDEENSSRILLGEYDDPSANTEVQARCNDSSNQADVMVEYRYELADLYGEIIRSREEGPDGGENSELLSEADMFRMYNDGIRQSPERFLALVSGGRSRGPNYRGTFDVTATAYLDQLSLGSVELKSPSSNNETVTDGVIQLDLDEIASGGVLRIVYEGHVSLECNNSVETERRARFFGGLPRLQIPYVPIND